MQNDPTHNKACGVCETTTHGNNLCPIGLKIYRVCVPPPLDVSPSTQHTAISSALADTRTALKVKKAKSCEKDTKRYTNIY
jgi:hypothetical protein